VASIQVNTARNVTRKVEVSMKSPRLSLYKTIDGFKVYIVDGEYIRKNLNAQFTDFGQYYRFPKMIPLKEFWLDRDFGKTKEYDYYIDHLLAEWNAMHRGANYNTAITEGDEVEHKERNLDEHEDYKIAKLGDVDGVGVWLVDGAKVRSDCYVDFTEGGHDLVYSWIPKDEIWLDDQISPKERPYILAHELDERSLMSEGQKYGKSHNQASFFERHLRHSEPSIGRLSEKNRQSRNKGVIVRIGQCVKQSLGSLK
jgi:hypothetical protein